MGLFTISQDTCNQDGICAAVCPAGIIEMHDDGYPSPAADADEICIRCGHCVAVCPTASLNHTDVPLEAYIPVEKHLHISHEQSVQFLRNRRSIRRYKDKPIPKTELQQLIDIARFAPSGQNSQCVEWLVLGEKTELQRPSGIVVDWMRWMVDNNPEVAALFHMERTISRWEDGNDVILREAPAVIVAHAHKENRAAPPACVIALTYLELAATTMRMGGCWAGYFNAAATAFRPMQEALPCPKITRHSAHDGGVPPVQIPTVAVPQRAGHHLAIIIRRAIVICKVCRSIRT